MFSKQQQVAKIWPKLKQSRKPHIWAIWGLRVNKQVKNLREVSKESS